MFIQCHPVSVSTSNNYHEGEKLQMCVEKHAYVNFEHVSVFKPHVDLPDDYLLVYCDGAKYAVHEKVFEKIHTVRLT